MVRIDAHLHVFAPLSPEFPRETDDVLAPDRDEGVEKFLAVMAEHGIDQAVLTQIGGITTEHHAYLIDCLRRYPTRFQGVAVLPLDLPDPVAQMATLADAGIMGFRLLELGGEAWANKPLRQHPLYPAWAYATERDLVIWLYPRLSDLPLVPLFLKEFPKVRIMLNHLGVTRGDSSFYYDETGRPRIKTAFPPPIHELLPEVVAHPNLVVKLSGQYAFSQEPYPYRDLAAWHETLYRSFGADRLVWASDFPWITKLPGYGAMLKLVDELLPWLSQQEREAILGGTAQRFLRFPALDTTSTPTRRNEGM